MKALRLKMYHFHTKLPHQKPMLWQIVCWLQNGPITRNGVFYLFIFFFWKFCFGLTTSYKKLMCCTNNANVHICTFCKCCSFISRCFFPVSILKTSRYSSLVCNLFETLFFFLQSFCFVLPFWITDLKASNFSRKVILKRQ